MRHIYLDLEKNSEKITCSFVGQVAEENLVVNLAVPSDFCTFGAEYYLVTEDKKKNETVFLSLLAKNGNTLIFSLPSHLLLPPTVKFFIGAYSRKNDEVFLVKETKPVYLFLSWSERDFKEAKE